jgi:hypothetical protein
MLGSAIDTLRVASRTCIDGDVLAVGSAILDGLVGPHEGRRDWLTVKHFAGRIAGSGAVKGVTPAARPVVRHGPLITLEGLPDRARRGPHRQVNFVPARLMRDGTYWS